MIKNIIFDFGGVLLDLDYEKTFVALTDVMGVKMTFDDIPAPIFKVMLGFEKGEINTETFLWNLQKLATKLTPQPDKLVSAWNAMLLGWNPERFAFLRALQDDYQTYLLSNTNELHLDWVTRDLKKTHKIQGFESEFFTKAYYSHQLTLRKPEVDIYHTVTQDAGLIPSETLFIDDNLDNVLAAREYGWHAVHHDPRTEIIEMLPSYIRSVG